MTTAENNQSLQELIQQHGQEHGSHLSNEPTVYELILFLQNLLKWGVITDQKFSELFTAILSKVADETAQEHIPLEGKNEVLPSLPIGSLKLFLTHLVFSLSAKLTGNNSSSKNF